MTNTLTAEQRLKKATVAILNKDRYRALAGVLMIGTKEIDDSVPTACTNGRDEKYGRSMVDAINDAELRYVMLHECRHKLYRHLTTWRHLHKIDPMLTNMAADYVINLELNDENDDGFATMPTGPYQGLVDTKYRGMNTQQVFNELRQQGEQGKGKGQGNGEGQAGFDEHDWDGAEELTEAEAKELEKELDNAIRQGALMAGKTGADMPRGFEALLQPQVDWREVLREFINATCAGKDYSTYRKPNRRYLSLGMYMPSGISERIGELVIGIDTSGSVGDRVLAHFLSELKSICEVAKPESIRLLYWGHNVVGDESYEAHELETLVKTTKPRGGGGTDPNCVCQYMQEKQIKPQAVVMLTDGYVPGWGNWGLAGSPPLLWCIIDRPNTKAPIGKTVHIKEA